MKEGLLQIGLVRIPQFVGTMLGAEFHLLCDALEKGYGAAINFKCIDPFGAIVVCLLGAKSHVAPLKVI